MRVVFFLVVFVLHRSLGFSKLPDYMKPCSRSDPHFNECALENGRKATPYIINGDPLYHIPSFKPLRVDYASLDAGEHIKLYASNLSLIGIEKIEMQEMDWNFDEKSIFVRLYIPTVEIIGTYNMNGRILIMNLKGSGKMDNMHYENNVKVNINYSLKTKRGKEYMKFDKLDIRLGSKNVHFDFDNLLNNPELSKTLNQFLNENWELLYKDLAPQVNRIIQTILLPVFDFIVDKVSFDNIVLP